MLLHNIRTPFLKQVALVFGTRCKRAPVEFVLNPRSVNINKVPPLAVRVHSRAKKAIKVAQDRALR